MANEVMKKILAGQLVSHVIPRRSLLRYDASASKGKAAVSNELVSNLKT